MSADRFARIFRALARRVKHFGSLPGRFLGQPGDLFPDLSLKLLRRALDDASPLIASVLSAACETAFTPASRAASMSSLLQPATPAAIAAAASTTNVLLLIMMRSFVHVDFSGGTAALRQYIGSWRKRLSCKGNRKATHWNKLQAVVGRGRRRSGPQRAIAARIAASCSSYQGLKVSLA